MHVIVASDTHLSARAREAQWNWDAVLRYVDTVQPDLVLHLGDLTLDGSSRPEELLYAREQLGRLAVEYHCIPGNHDLGDTPTRMLPPDMYISDERRVRWLELMGPDHWALERDGWRLVAVNAQLLGSGLGAEHSHWIWLEAQLEAAAQAGQHIALLTHKPVAASEDELAATLPFMFVRPAVRERLRLMFRAYSPKLVLSGHMHQHRVLDIDDVRHLWAPTTWAVLPDKLQPPVGIKRTGVLRLELEPDGRVRAERIEPYGLRQLTMFRDIEDPYPEHRHG